MKNQAKGLIIIARKYKQVHRKEIVYDLKEWAEIERRAAECHTDTSKYIKYKSLHDDAVFYDMKEVAPLLNGLRIISNNVNQVAKKANETNNIYAEDVDKLRKEVESLSHTLSIFVSTLTSRKV